MNQRKEQESKPKANYFDPSNLENEQLFVCAFCTGLDHNKITKVKEPDFQS